MQRKTIKDFFPKMIDLDSNISTLGDGKNSEINKNEHNLLKDKKSIISQENQGDIKEMEKDLKGIDLSSSFNSNHLQFNIKGRNQEKSIFLRNEIKYEYLWKRNKIQVFESRREDKLFSYKLPSFRLDKKKSKLNTLKKVKKFRDLINAKLK
jgi:hypothetical protein